MDPQPFDFSTLAYVIRGPGEIDIAENVISVTKVPVTINGVSFKLGEEAHLPPNSTLTLSRVGLTISVPHTFRSINRLGGSYEE